MIACRHRHRHVRGRSCRHVCAFDVPSRRQRQHRLRRRRRPLNCRQSQCLV